MFTIIGGDGKEYGPATADQVRAWITAGRANLETKARAVGSEEWRRLGDYAEFSGSASIPPPVDAPVSPTFGAPAYGAPASAAVAATPLVTPQAADPGPRLVARLIDWIISIATVIPGGLMMGGEFITLITTAMRGEQIDFESIDAQRLAAGASVLLGGWLLGLIVQVVLLSTRSQSIGKIVMRLKVIRLDGTPGGFLHGWLLREALITVIGFFLGLLPMIGLLLRPAFHLTDWCFVFRGDHRCLHDLIAGTKVIKL